MYRLMITPMNRNTSHIHWKYAAANSTPRTTIAIWTKNENTVIAAFCDSSFSSFLKKRIVSPRLIPYINTYARLMQLYYALRRTK